MIRARGLARTAPAAIVRAYPPVRSLPLARSVTPSPSFVRPPCLGRSPCLVRPASFRPVRKPGNK